MAACMVKVWNDNKLVFRQKFKEALIEIPAGEFVEMQWDEAQEFKSLFYPPQRDGSGVQKPESYKMLRIEGNPPHLVGASIEEHVCGSCNDKFASESDLDKHIDRHHLDELEDQDVASKRRKKRAAAG